MRQGERYQFAAVEIERFRQPFEGLFERCTMWVTKRMHVTIEHVFERIVVGDFVSLYFDETFNDALSKELKLGRHLVRFDQSDKRIVRHVCYEPAREAGHAIDHAYGSSAASFVEELDYDRATRRGTWRTVPNKWADRVRNAGTIEFAAAGPSTRRRVEADVKIKAFGFGGIVERMVVAEIEKNYAATTAFTRAWLARAPH
jgi:hypothetical protein